MHSSGAHCSPLKGPSLLCHSRCAIAPLVSSITTDIASGTSFKMRTFPGGRRADDGPSLTVRWARRSVRQHRYVHRGTSWPATDFSLGGEMWRSAFFRFGKLIADARHDGPAVCRLQQVRHCKCDCRHCQNQKSEELGLRHADPRIAERHRKRHLRPRAAHRAINRVGKAAAVRLPMRDLILAPTALRDG